MVEMRRFTPSLLGAALLLSSTQYAAAQQARGTLLEATPQSATLQLEEGGEKTLAIAESSVLMLVLEKGLEDLEDGTLVQVDGALHSPGVFDVRQLRNNTRVNKNAPHFRRQNSAQGFLDKKTQPPRLMVNGEPLTLQGAHTARVIFIYDAEPEELAVGGRAFANYEQRGGEEVIKGLYSYPDEEEQNTTAPAAQQDRSTPAAPSVQRPPSGPTELAVGSLKWSNSTTLSLTDEQGKEQTFGVAPYSDFKQVVDISFADLVTGDVLQVGGRRNDATGTIQPRYIRRITKLAPEAPDRLSADESLGRADISEGDLYLKVNDQRYHVPGAQKVHTVDLSRVTPDMLEPDSKVRVNYDLIQGAGVVRGVFYYPVGEKKN